MEKSPAFNLVELLKKNSLTLSTAESCTGGKLSGELTKISGVSAVFYGGFVTYNNHIKNKILGVKEETLSTYSAVSKETAYEMAVCAAEKMGTDAAISVTGNAGPNESEGKPVGMVFVGIYFKGECRVYNLQEYFKLPLTREEIRDKTIEFAIIKLTETVKNYLK